ncbi:MAG: DNA-directed RNA polymerase subunit omega [Caldicoprobacterales bacterium]|jgi:DNA-directed RNA polymerase subunit omega|nr:DNA-directed RNA polymerase subunit omega [Clostridiales bacterium]
MIYPTLKSLVSRVDSKYTLVVEVSKRARQLVAGAKPLIDDEELKDKPVSIAIREVEEGLISYRRRQ